MPRTYTGSDTAARQITRHGSMIAVWAGYVAVPATGAAESVIKRLESSRPVRPLPVGTPQPGAAPRCARSRVGQLEQLGEDVRTAAVSPPHRSRLRGQPGRQDEPVIVRAVAHRQGLVLTGNRHAVSPDRANADVGHGFKPAVGVAGYVVAPPVPCGEPPEQRCCGIAGTAHRAARRCRPRQPRCAAPDAATQPWQSGPGGHTNAAATTRRPHSAVYRPLPAPSPAA